MSLTFHETFSLDFSNISRLLDAVTINPTISDEEIQHETGMGNKKVQPTIKYTSYCGLLKKDDATKELSVTELGKRILEFDKYLTSPVTHWTIHYQLSSPTSGAPFWSYFVYSFLPKNNQFTRETLKSGLDSFGTSINENSKNKTITVLLNSYLNNEGFYKTKIIKEVEPKRYRREPANHSNVYLAAYILAEVWETHYSGNTWVAHETLFDDSYYSAAMNMGKDEIQKYLNAMSAAGLIEQMREAPPHQVMKKWDDKFDLLEKAYQPN